MPTKRRTFTHESSRTTGNEPIEAIDPGGTRGTKVAQTHRDRPDGKESKMRQRISSGDRNTMPASRDPDPRSD